ncbi:MAG TPA: hypothetical protein VMK16_05340 [Acidimicrobiales bacterium]|nr:hypothetical protein [Acidimicrobiales bacterium]
MDAAGAERAVAALAASQHSALGRRQAASLGFTARMAATRLRSGVLSEPVPGVLVFTTAPRSWRQQLMVATLARAGAVVSHEAAAALHGLDGFAEGPLAVTVRPSQHHLITGFTVHRAILAREDRMAVDAIACTNLARTLCDLGAVVKPDKLEQALDDALRRGVSERWIRETLDRVDRPGPSGTAALRRVLDLPDRAGLVPDSWFERLVERLLQGSVLPAPVRQHEVHETGGSRVAYLDLAWPEVGLAVEPSGAKAHAGVRRTRRDHMRDAWLTVEDWEVMYAVWNDLDRPDRFLRAVEQVYLRRAAARFRV